MADRVQIYVMGTPKIPFRPVPLPLSPSLPFAVYLIQVLRPSFPCHFRRLVSAVGRPSVFGLNAVAKRYHCNVNDYHHDSSWYSSLLDATPANSGIQFSFATVFTYLLDRPFYERSILCFAHVSFFPNSLFPTSANRYFRNFSTWRGFTRKRSAAIPIS